MSVRVVRQSKFRHVFGTANKREQCYDNVRITGNAWDSLFSSVNPKFLAVALEAQGGGQFQVIPVEQFGRVDQAYPRVIGHEAPILDLQFNPHNDNVIASCSEDCTVRVWEIPDGGLTGDLTSAVQVLRGHQRRVGIVEWHPTVENMLFSAGFDYYILVWNVGTGELLRDIQLHSDTIFSMSFNYDGTLLATTSKDKQLRIINARNGELVSSGPTHDGSKASRACFAGSTGRVITTGFNRSSERQVALWDPKDLSRPLKLESVDNGSGVLFASYDEDTKLLFISGKGDGNIRYYELVDEAPWFHYVSDYKSQIPQRSVCWLPKRGVSVTDCEVARGYKLGAKGTIEPIAFTVPRKSTLFQDDLFPPTKEDAAIMTVAEWLSGVTRQPKKVSLRGNQATSLVSVASLSAPQAAPVAAASPKPVVKAVTPAPAQVKPAPVSVAAPAVSTPQPPQGEQNLLKAWHAQQKEIEDLKKRIAQLEAR
eukprot:m.337405 g.337405  ORF g.337405 m.337405 type:complete len:481 (+) comp55719_c0_seq1:590-2032(+)